MSRSHRPSIDPHHHHGINCDCPECNTARRRREVESVAQDLESVRNTLNGCDSYSPRSDPEFAVLDDWSDD